MLFISSGIYVKMFEHCLSAGVAKVCFNAVLKYVWPMIDSLILSHQSTRSKTMSDLKQVPKYDEKPVRRTVSAQSFKTGSNANSFKRKNCFLCSMNSMNTLLVSTRRKLLFFNSNCYTFLLTSRVSKAVNNELKCFCQSIQSFITSNNF